MRCYDLKSTDTYVTHMLIVESNSFGDQILKIRYEDLQGRKKYIWTEINHEGEHRVIDDAFLKYMTNNPICEVKHDTSTKIK